MLMIIYVKAHFTYSCWHNTVNGLMEHSLQILKDVLYDHTRPFTSHYGAITALSAFGLQVF